MGAYEDHLRHIAEPQAPSEREKAVKATIEDHEALWFADHLREFAHYNATDSQGGIAIGYASFIDKKIRDEGKSYVTLYVHTDVAAETLLDALYGAVPESTEDRNLDAEDGASVSRRADSPRNTVPMSIVRSLEEEFAAAMAHHIEDEYAPEDAPEPTVDEEIGLVFDAEEARQSIAEMQMAKAEAAHEKELDRRREKAFDEGRI